MVIDSIIVTTSRGDFVVDLTHTLDVKTTPLTPGGFPLEVSLENHDEGNGGEVRNGLNYVVRKIIEHLCSQCRQ